MRNPVTRASWRKTKGVNRFPPACNALFVPGRVHLELVKKSGKIPPLQDQPVPTGVPGVFQRMLQIYREYKKATTSAQLEE